MTTFVPCSARRGTRCSAGIVACTVLTLLLFGSGPPALGNPLDFVLWQELTGVCRGDGQWGDFDGDGDLDLVISGYDDEHLPDFVPVTETYENQGGTLVFRQNLIGVANTGSGNLAWGDYDGDGDLDLAIAGRITPSAEMPDIEKIARIYQNDGSGNLTWDTQQDLTAVMSASVAWGDYDNDGDLDLVVIGALEYLVPGPAILYKNDPPGTLTPDPAVSLTWLCEGSADWGDYDCDGDLDLLLTGHDGTTHRTIFYENDPVGTLTDTGTHGVPAITRSDMAWGDYDNDGDLDLAYTGAGPPDPSARIYRNDGAGVFTQVAGLFTATYGSCAWGDYDNDGDLDVGFSGGTSAGRYSRIYENTGSAFVHAFSIHGMSCGSVSWADVDQDADLDFFLTGSDTYPHTNADALLYENVGGTPNTTPIAPTELTCDSAGGGLHLSWSGASDAETPTAGLYYCLRVGTSPGAHDVMSGCYGTPLMGNVHQPTDWVLNVPSGTYYWSVRTIDSGFMASPWSEEMVCEFDRCEGDITGDGATDQIDLGILLALWGQCEGDPNYEPRADLDGDGCIGHADLGILLADWGCGT